MSSFVKSFFSQDGDGQRASENIIALRENWPNLTDALLGCKDPDGKEGVPPITLMLFLEGDTLKFCLSPKWGGKVAFGTIVDPSKGLQAVEDAIRAGEFEWKKRRQSR